MFRVETQDQRIKQEFKTADEAIGFALPQSHEALFIVLEAADDERPWLLTRYHAIVYENMVWLPLVDQNGYSTYGKEG